MSEDPRARIVDQLMGEILGYVVAEFLPRADPATWDRMDAPDRAMTAAIGAFERGELDYEGLESAGVAYVEAWERVVTRPSSQR